MTDLIEDLYIAIEGATALGGPQRCFHCRVSAPQLTHSSAKQIKDLERHVTQVRLCSIFTALFRSGFHPTEYLYAPLNNQC